MLMKLGAAKKEAGQAYALMDITLPPKEQLAQTNSLVFTLNRLKLRVVRRREGHYLLRTNLTEHDPAKLWQFYIQLTEVEQAFKELKNDLAIRPIYHQKDECIEAHICLLPGLLPASDMEGQGQTSRRRAHPQSRA
ncbi:MAG: hypothetical protein IPP88_04570 [Betaproteobacteria bacterium]|nr:hypothetical protein [Betaproteobacteria bacterium]